MTLRHDVEEIIETAGHFGEITLLRPRTVVGLKLRTFFATLVAAHYTETATLQERAERAEKEVDGLRAQNEQLTKRLQQIEALPAVKLQNIAREALKPRPGY